VYFCPRENEFMNPILAFFFLFLMTFFSCTFAQDNSDGKKNLQDTIRKVGEVKNAPFDVLTPPLGFDTTSYFKGYFNPKKGASIMLNEIQDVGFFQLENGMNEAYYEKNKMTFISKSELRCTSGTKGLIYKMSFDQHGIPFLRYVVFAGDETHTLWIHVTLPGRYEAELEAPLLECFRSINYYPIESEKK